MVPGRTDSSSLLVDPAFRRTALAARPASVAEPGSFRLAQAGVVDAGGAGYVLLLESLERVVTGEIPPESFAGDDPLPESRTVNRKLYEEAVGHK